MQSYILTSAIALGVLLTLYYLLLQREKMHRFNRFYLLGSLVFAMVLPFIKIGSLPDLAPSVLPELNVGTIPNAITTKTDSLPRVINIIYVAVAVLLFIRLIMGINRFYVTAQKNKKIIYGNIKLILVDNLPLPYTFGNMVFVNRAEYETLSLPHQLLQHELAHANQYHTMDILFVEALKTVFWFNPLLYLYKHAIQLNHEFLADEAVVSNGTSKEGYMELLLQKASCHIQVSLAGNLNFGMTRKRFIMITKTTNPMKKLIKQLAILPVAAALVVVSCSDDGSNSQIPQQKKLKEVNDLQEWASKALEANNKFPQYPGGMAAFSKLVSKNFDVKAPAGNLKLTISFVVEADGSISDIKALRSPSQQLTNEAIRVIKASGKWIPAQDENGNAVRASYILPIVLQRN